MTAHAQPEAGTGVLRKVGRRFFVPLAVTIALFDLIAAASGRLGGLLGEAPILELAIGAVLAPGLPVGFGLLFFGLPLGFAVARLRLGFVESLAVLVAIGFAIPAGLLALVTATHGDRDLVVPLLAGLPGAATAAVWTAINHDLFRRRARA